MMNLFRKLVIVANATLFVVLLVTGIIENVFEETIGSISLFFGLLLLTISNVYFIFHSPEENGWLGLFLKRKMAEERQRIKSLENQGN